MSEPHSTNITANSPNMSSGKSRYLLSLVRVVRMLAGAGLIIGFVPIFFIFPMLFDSPDTPPLLVLGVLASFPLSFVLTSQPYKNSFVQGKMVKALLYGTAPLLLIVCFAGMLGGIYWLDSNYRYPSDVIVTSDKGSKLFVKIPEKCSPNVYVTKLEMMGTWRLSQDKVDFSCSSNSSDNNDQFLISNALSTPTVKTEGFGDWQLIAKDGDKETFRHTKDASLEITAFTADDRQRVFVRYLTSPTNRPYFKVSRRLDDQFELTYSMSQPTGNLARLVEIDRQVVSYARSITHRINVLPSNQ